MKKQESGKIIDLSSQAAHDGGVRAAWISLGRRNQTCQLNVIR